MAEKPKSSIPPEITALPFEEAYQQLRAIAGELEGEGLTLEESLARYERALQLAGRCQALLQDAEDRIQILQDGVYRAVQIDISS